MKPSEAFNTEIAQLEAKLEAKKQEAAQAGLNSPEKRVFSEVLKEHIQKTPNSSPKASLQAPLTATNNTAAQDDSQDSEPAKQFIAKLIQESFDKGIVAAIQDARKTQDAYLLDRFHDALVDQYYDKLLEARQIKET